MYHFIDRLHTLYELLQDEQSKEIFQARFDIDMEISISSIKRLMKLGSFKEQAFMGHLQPLKDELKELNRENKKIILYGTAITGKLLAGLLQSEHIDFYGFCGQNAERFSNGLFGKPVLSPDELIVHGDEYYIVLAVSAETYPEVSHFLKEHNYPQNHVLKWINVYSTSWDEKQYFEFPELYHRGTAFIDGGCYDCIDSYRFAKWCEGAYSSIIAFEPDPDNYAICCKKIQDVPLPNFQLVNAGLSDQEGRAVFDARNTTGSRIMSAGADSDIKNKVSVRTVAIDDIVEDRTVGFIKLDIEGAELDALHGAKNTILRDKPLLAICVYHLRGDVFAIMDYLHQLLPEYRFLLRHYTTRHMYGRLYYMRQSICNTTQLL